MALQVRSKVRKPAAEMSPELDEAKKRTEEAGNNIRAQREAAFAEFSEDAKKTTAAAGKVPGAHTAAPKIEEPTVFVRENIKAIRVKLQDREFLIGPPVGVSINIAMLRMFEGLAFSSNESRIARATCYVREMDGAPVDIPRNLIERDMLITKIGDAPLAGVLMLADQYWPPLQVSELVVVEKKYT